MSFFGLHTNEYTWKDLGEKCAPLPRERLVDLAVRRLRERYPNAERRGGGIVVESDGEERGAIEALATAEPYPLGPGPMFLPYRCVEAPNAEAALEVARASFALPVLTWKGTVASSRLRLVTGTTLLADGMVNLRAGGHHVYYERVTTDDDVVTLINGEPMDRPTRPYSAVIFVTRRSAPEQALTLLTWSSLGGLVYVARQASHEAFPRTALIHAELRGLERSLAIVEQPVAEGFRAPAAPGLEVTSYADEEDLRIVAAGEHDALVVFCDQLREQLAGAKLVIGSPAPGEKVLDFERRLERELRPK